MNVAWRACHCKWEFRMPTTSNLLHTVYAATCATLDHAAGLENGHEQLCRHLEINQIRQNLFTGPTAGARQRHLTIVVQLQEAAHERVSTEDSGQTKKLGAHRASCNPSSTLECTGRVQGTDARGRRKLRGLRPATGTKSAASLS